MAIYTQYVIDNSMHSIKNNHICTVSVMCMQYHLVMSLFTNINYEDMKDFSLQKKPLVHLLASVHCVYLVAPFYSA